MITVLTATFNSEKTIERLAKSLSEQSDKEFAWVIIDNCSTDSTIDVAKTSFTGHLNVICEQDHGIYDAINKGIKEAKTPYYLVVGSDDFLFPEAIEKFNQAATLTNADIISANTLISNSVKKPKKRGLRAYHRQFIYISSHSGSTLLKKELHKKFGNYDMTLLVAADQKFLMDVFSNKHTSYHHIDYVAASFSTTGVSSRYSLATEFEIARVQRRYDNPALVYLIFTARLLKRIFKFAF